MCPIKTQACWSDRDEPQITDNDWVDKLADTATMLSVQRSGAVSVAAFSAAGVWLRYLLQASTSVEAKKLIPQLEAFGVTEYGAAAALVASAAVVARNAIDVGDVRRKLKKLSPKALKQFNKFDSY